MFAGSTSCCAEIQEVTQRLDWAPVLAPRPSTTASQRAFARILMANKIKEGRGRVRFGAPASEHERLESEPGPQPHIPGAMVWTEEATRLQAARHGPKRAAGRVVGANQGRSIC